MWGGCHPDLIADEGVEGQVGEAAVLPVPDPIRHSSVSPVAELEGGDVATLCVDDEAGVPEALCIVQDGHLSPRVVTLSAHEQPGVLRPVGPRHQLGESGDPRTIADRAVGFRGLDPVLFLHEHQSVTYPLVEGESDGEVAGGNHEGVNEPVGARVGPDQDRVGDEDWVVVREVAGLVLLG